MTETEAKDLARATIADALRAHEISLRGRCACGEMVGRHYHLHVAHLADMVAHAISRETCPVPRDRLSLSR